LAQNVPEGFEEFLGDMDSKNAEDLVEQHPQLKQFIDEVKEYSGSEWNEEHATRLIHHHSNFEFLVNLHVAIPRNFKFTEDGKFSLVLLVGIIAANGFCYFDDRCCRTSYQIGRTNP
jgi:hypothetical protein